MKKIIFGILCLFVMVCFGCDLQMTPVNTTQVKETMEETSITFEITLKGMTEGSSYEACLHQNEYVSSKEITSLRQTIVFSELEENTTYTLDIYEVMEDQKNSIFTKEYKTLQTTEDEKMEVTGKIINLVATSSEISFDAHLSIVNQGSNAMPSFSVEYTDGETTKAVAVEYGSTEKIVLTKLTANTEYTLTLTAKLSLTETMELDTKTISTLEEEKVITPGLFISEYVEGYYHKDYNPTGNDNDKAIELYNPTKEAIDLSAYKITIYASLTDTPKYEISLTGILESESCFVIVNQYAQQELLDKADMTGSLYYSGKHAVALEKDGEVIDIIGVIGADLSASMTVNGVTEALKDNRLIRNKGFYGNPVFTESEWTVANNVSFADLGIYSTELNPLEETIQYLTNLYEEKTFSENVAFPTTYKGLSLLFESYDDSIITGEGVVTLTGQSTQCWIQVTITGYEDPYYLTLTVYVL